MATHLPEVAIWSLWLQLFLIFMVTLLLFSKYSRITFLAFTAITFLKVSCLPLHKTDSFVLLKRRPLFLGLPALTDSLTPFPLQAHPFQARHPNSVPPVQISSFLLWLLLSKAVIQFH